MESAGRKFSKAERLTGRTEISALFSAHHSGFVYPFRYVWAERAGDVPSALLISVGKKYHKRAVRRNLLKRRIREAYRLNKGSLTVERPIALGLIYCTKEILPYGEIEQAMRKIVTMVAACNASGLDFSVGSTD